MSVDRLATNEFGYTPWGMDWVRLAEPLAQKRPDPLLPRARSIARNNGVTAEFEGRIAHARIHRGNDASVVHVEVAPMSWERITALGSGLAGALTNEVYAAITAAGESVAPTIVSTDCSCSARTARCVHVLALFYETARRVDDDPRITLQLQDFYRATADNAAVEDAAQPPRWTLLSGIDAGDFFTVTN
ncbi:hypothetical protein [Antrihabitans spumae]|uniref:SWIM-type domain-containing protein n=1 Tax=Antrihabitans spumae TaxID=3373370 RepID=A0ABW7K6X5_9NOCA